jgi:diaminopimelate decarboxylase
VHFFKYKGKSFYAEGVAVEKIAEEVGTPVFIYSKKTLTRHFKAYADAFKGTSHLVCYSVKANSNLAVLKTFNELGSGFDIVSVGELHRVIKAGGDTASVVFSGVGKRDDEIEFAIKKNILMFNVESPQELRAVDRIAGRLKKKAGVAIRVNPNVNAKTHPYISTGLKKNKFGIETKAAIKEYVFARANLKNLELLGVDCHIGSQITQITPFTDAIVKIKKLIVTLRESGIDVKYLNMGGGLGITYKDEVAPHPSKYAEAVVKHTKALGMTLIFEPGRSMVGNAGILATRVTCTKKGSTKNFTIMDAGMNDLPRPSFYGSYHGIVPVRLGRGKKVGLFKGDVVGPICESGDFLGQDITIEETTPGGLLAVMSAGAYCFSMSSNYNSRPRAVEVMVDGKDYYVVRRRESLADLTRGETMPDGLFKKKKSSGQRSKK